MKIKQYYLSFFLILSLTKPVVFPYNAIAEIENLNYNLEKVTVTGDGKDLTSAIDNAELKAMELSLFSHFVQTEVEKSNFSKIKEELNKDKKKYVKMLKIIGKSSSANGRELNAEFEVNLAGLKDYLINNKVITANIEIAKTLLFPKILVFYEDLSQPNEDYSKWSVSRANNFLVSQKFNVIDEKTITKLKDEDTTLQKNIQKIRNNKTNQQIAIQTKPDIYMSIKVGIEEVGKSGNFTYIKASVEVKAYESSSDIPFIVKTYKRLNKNGEEEALAIEKSSDITSKAVIEESVAGVMPGITDDLLLHWKNSIANGRQYILQVEGLNKPEILEIVYYLKTLCNDVSVSQNIISIKYKNPLDEVTDSIEKQFGDNMKLILKSSDSGKAVFIKEKL